MQKLLKLALSIGVSLAILALMLHLVGGGLDPASRPRILDILSATSMGLVATYVGLHLVQLFMRAWRYRILIQAAGEESVPAMPQMLLVTGVRNMLVDMLPARIGELGYVAMLNRGYRVSAEACLASLSIAVAFDFAALFLVVVAITMKQWLSSGFEGWLLGAMIVAAVLAMIALGALFIALPRFAAWIKEKGLFAGNRLLAWATDLLARLAGAIDATRESGRLVSVLTLSLIIRLLKYGGLYLLFRAVTDNTFPDIAAQGVEKIIGALIGSEIGASLPIPAFMSFGTYEAGGTLVSTILGMNQREAFTSLFAVHIWSQFVDYSLGALCLVLFVLFYPRRAGSERPARGWLLAGIAATGMVLASGSALLALEYRATKKLGAVNAPPAGQSVIDQHVAQHAASAGFLARENVSGFMVWSTNRGGGHDIYRMSLPEMAITRLTWHPHTEYYPRVSPDGSKIVFARSQQPWVSQRNIVAWDVYVMDLASGRETLLETHATYPAWVDDNTVTVLRNAVQVIAIDTNTLEKERVYESGAGNPMPGGANIHTPSYNPANGVLAFTGRQAEIGMRTGFWGTALLDRNATLKGVLDGCQITWSRSGSHLFQVGHGGRQKTRFYRIDPGTAEATPWLDMPGDFSHEYFPSDSADGRFLVFGASTGGHEHDSADYEMFLWKVGDAPDNAVRLTFHTGNDNWPDIYLEP